MSGFHLYDISAAQRGCRAAVRPRNLREMIPTITGQIQLPDRFRIDCEIGRGGMAVVYRAHDSHLGRQVAIKVLAEHLSNAVGSERFQREIALMAKLVHPGIVALFDSGETDGRLFYVMPFVPGETLRDRLNREKRVPLEDAASWGADIAEALAYAHGLGIIHRDVKPENIFALGGRALLSDFGIAQVTDALPHQSQALTTAGTIIGTSAYMSPEQIAGTEHIDGQSDLYALGCVLYELISGAPPFSAPTQVAMLARHLTEAPKPLSQMDVQVSAGMEDIVMRLLSKKPEERPHGAVEVARALRAELSGNSGETLPVKKADAPVPKTSPADDLVEKGRQAWRRGVPGGVGARAALEEGRAHFERALELDPHNARALTAMSNYHSVAAIRGFADRTEGFRKGRQLLFRALAADDQCAETYTSLGIMALYFDDDFHAAARHIERALEINPTDADAVRFKSVVLKMLGRSEEAVEAAAAATKLAPDAPSLWNGLGDALLAAGRNAEAVDALKHAINLKAGYAPAFERLELAYLRIGEMSRAMEMRVARLRVTGRAERAALLERESTDVGFAEARRTDLRRELDELLAKAEKEDPFFEYSSSTSHADSIVATYAELGEWSKAMDWIERAYEARPGRLRRMLTDHLYDHHGLAVDPRYARLLRVAGLEELL